MLRLSLLLSVVLVLLAGIDGVFASPTLPRRNSKARRGRCVPRPQSSLGPSPSTSSSVPANKAPVQPVTSNSEIAKSSSTPLPPPSSPPSPPPKPASTSPPSSAPSSAPPSGGSSSTSSSDIDQYLSAHNTIRAQHGAAPLTWSDELAGKAQQWANGCVFQHSGGSLGAFGENLAAGTGSSYDIAAGIKSWTDEVSEYDPNNPQPSHFTQVVWKASTQVGCAVQSCNGIFAASFGAAKYYVCEYSPAGNVIGDFPQNVQV